MTAVAAMCMLGDSAAAEANGAFPDSLQLLLPRADPARTIVATTFGLILSEDGDRDWEWSCEHGASLGGWLYQLGRGSRILAISTTGLALSDDFGCAWRLAGGIPTGAVVKDFFVDAGDPQRVLCVVTRWDDAAARDQLLRSDDGGDSFSPTALAVPSDASIVSIETAAADPDVIYVTVRWAQPQGRSQLGKSADGGDSWEMLDLTDDLAAGDLAIIGVGRSQSDRVLFRSKVGLRDRVALTEDGGRTTRVVLETAGVLTSYVERSSGAMVIGAIEVEGGVLFSSDDGGQSFQRLAPAPHFRALSERDGHLFALGDDSLDGFAFGTSPDNGKTWIPRMRFSQISRVRNCPGLAATCAESCDQLARVGAFTGAVCGRAPAGLDASKIPDGSSRSSVPSADGCQCSMSSCTPSAIATVASLVSLITFASVLRRRGRCRR